MTVEVAQGVGEQRVRREKAAGQRRAEDPEALGGRVDHDSRIDAEEVLDSGDVVTVTVRDHDEIEPREIDAERADVGREDLGIVSGVEQNPPATVFDQRGEPPVAGQPGPIAESVVEDCHSLGRCGVTTDGACGP